MCPKVMDWVKTTVGNIVMIADGIARPDQAGRPDGSLTECSQHSGLALSLGIRSKPLRSKSKMTLNIDYFYSSKRNTVQPKSRALDQNN